MCQLHTVWLRYGRKSEKLRLYTTTSLPYNATRPARPCRPLPQQPLAHCLDLQSVTSAALPAAAPSLHPIIHHLAPLNDSIPTIPARFASAQHQQRQQQAFQNGISRPSEDEPVAATCDTFTYQPMRQTR